VLGSGHLFERIVQTPVASSWSVLLPSETSPAAPSPLAETFRHPPCTESRLESHPQNERNRLPLDTVCGSGAQTIDRARSVGKRSTAAATGSHPAGSLLHSLLSARPPSLLPSTSARSAEAAACRPLVPQGISSSTRDSRGRKIPRCPPLRHSSLSSAESCVQVAPAHRDTTAPADTRRSN